MATVIDLMGLGTAPLPAEKIGHVIATGVQGVGTAQSGAKAIAQSVTVGVPITNQTAYALPTGSVSMAKEFYFYNDAASAVTALIYPPTGGATLNGSTSAALSVAQNKGAMFMCVSGAGGSAPKWFSILTG